MQKIKDFFMKSSLIIKTFACGLMLVTHTQLAMDVADLKIKDSSKVAQKPRLLRSENYQRIYKEISKNGNPENSLISIATNVHMRKAHVDLLSHTILVDNGEKINIGCTRHMLLITLLSKSISANGKKLGLSLTQYDDKYLFKNASRAPEFFVVEHNNEYVAIEGFIVNKPSNKLIESTDEEIDFSEEEKKNTPKGLVTYEIKDSKISIIANQSSDTKKPVMGVLKIKENDICLIQYHNGTEQVIRQIPYNNDFIKKIKKEAQTNYIRFVENDITIQIKIIDEKLHEIPTTLFYKNSKMIAGGAIMVIFAILYYMYQDNVNESFSQWFNNYRTA